MSKKKKKKAAEPTQIKVALITCCGCRQEIMVETPCPLVYEVPLAERIVIAGEVVINPFRRIGQRRFRLHLGGEDIEYHEELE